MDAEYWNGEAGLKWAESQEFMDRMLTPFAETLVEATAARRDGVIVDVGCGCGDTTLRIAADTPDATVIGVDVSGPMLTVARRRAADAGLRIAFEHADATVARPHDGPVDRVISRFGIMFFAEPDKAFANLRSWLADDGRLVALVWGPLADNPWLGDLLQIVSRHAEMAPMPPNAPGPFSLGDPDRLEALLRAAGFADVSQRNLDTPMRIPGTADDAVEFCMGRGPVAKALQELAPPIQDAIAQEVRAHVESLHDGEGTPLQARARLVVAHAKA